MRKSYNWQYILPTVFFIALDSFMLSCLVKRHIWAVILIDIIAIALIAKVISKFSNLPHPIDKYGKLEKADFQISSNKDIEVYLSETMGKYDFLGRIAEVTSSLSGKAENKLIINKKILEEEGKRFVQMAGTREILKYNRKIHLKNYLGVSIPVLAIIAIVATFLAFYSFFSERLPLVFLTFLLPFLLAALFVGSLFHWNKMISQRDFLLDREMLNYYRLEEVEAFIKNEEKII